ncbi:LPS-assembly protein LptD [Paracoccaceae bacterium GXU_MW_L88]
MLRAAALVLTLATPALAQQSALIADMVTVDGDLVTAEGNVEIYAEEGRLTASRVIYDQSTGEIRAEDLLLQGPDGEVVTAEDAVIDDEMEDALINGARLLLDERFQIAAAEAKRTAGRWTTAFNATATACGICETEDTPLWRIRAAKILRDEVEGQIWFEDARFDLLGVPIFGLPRLRMADPSAGRASGILPAHITHSGVYGLGVKLPFFYVLGPRSDVTLTPFVTSMGTVLFEPEYRLNFSGGGLRINGAFALMEEGDLTADRGMISIDAWADLGNGYLFNADVNAADDESFLSDYDYSDTDRLTSIVTISRLRAHDYFAVSMLAFQDFRDDVDKSEIPFVLPDMTFRRTFDDDYGGGRFGLSADALGLYREEGRSVFRAGIGGDYFKAFTLPAGIRAETTFEIFADGWRVWDDPAFDEDEIIWRTGHQAQVDLRWPWSKSGSDGVTHIVEPVVQLVASDVSTQDVPNDDSLQVEFDETNLFDIDRYPGDDRVETGKRAHIGVNYRRIAPSGWTIGTTVGQVLRLDPEEDFDEISGLDGKESDFVGAAYFVTEDTSLVARALFDNDFELSRFEVLADYNFDPFSFDVAYAYLEPDATAGALETREEIDFDIGWDVNRRWSVTAGLQRNLKDDENVEARGGLIYRHDCAILDLSVSRSFTTSNNIEASTNVGLDLSLAGFSAGNYPARECSR